jgi:hypothetical protein
LYETLANKVVWFVLETNSPVLTREVLESAGEKLATGHNRVIVWVLFFKNGWNPDFF